MGTHDYPTEGEQVVDDGLTISWYRHGSRAVAKLEGDLDMYASGRLTEELGQVLQSSIETLEIDAGQLGFVDSAGLRSVLWALAEAQGREIDFQVTAVSPAVERVIELAGVREVLLPPAA